MRYIICLEDGELDILKTILRRPCAEAMGVLQRAVSRARMEDSGYRELERRVERLEEEGDLRDRSIEELLCQLRCLEKRI